MITNSHTLAETGQGVMLDAHISARRAVRVTNSTRYAPIRRMAPAIAATAVLFLRCLFIAMIIYIIVMKATHKLVGGTTGFVAGLATGLPLTVAAVISATAAVSSS